MVRHRITGDILVTCFLVVQLIDWFVTWEGVRLFGLSFEANPILRSLMMRYDIVLVLTIAKVVAGAAGSYLHILNRHATVGFLTAFYTLFAILPWIEVLSL